MKQIFLFIVFLSLASFAQDKNISVISVKYGNVVYRGITNPIKIAVQGAKFFKADAYGIFEKIDSIGNYSWNVTGVTGTKISIRIDAVMANNKVIHEEKEFEIRPIRNRRTYVKSEHNWTTNEMTHEQLKNLSLATILDDFPSLTDTIYNKIENFTISTEGEEDIWILGSKITDKVYRKLKQLPNGTELIIHQISTYNPHQYDYGSLPSIKIAIVDIDVNDSFKPLIKNKYGNNIVYRGIVDTLKIEVPNVKSFIVTAPGLSEMSQDSTYTINVSKIKEDKMHLDFTITMHDNSIINTSELLYIKDITPKKIAINDKSCSNCILKMKLSEFKNAVIDVVIDDKENSYSSGRMWGFNIKMPDGSNFEINGNTITDEIFAKLLKLRKKSVIEIAVPYYVFPGFTYAPPPLKVMLVENY